MEAEVLFATPRPTLPSAASRMHRKVRSSLSSSTGARSHVDHPSEQVNGAERSPWRSMITTLAQPREMGATEGARRVRPPKRLTLWRRLPPRADYVT
jgi:hypothetical protein